MSIAVTGATGFIGRHVITELERRGVSPTLVCRTLSSVLPEFRKHAIVAFDLSDPPTDVFELLGGPETVIHLAWGGLPSYKSLHHFEEELSAQYRFLKTLVNCGVKNVIVTGTCFEYGMQSGALHEELDAKPTNPYGFAKNALRAQLEYLQQTVAFNLTWTRLFYLYGDGQAASSLLPLLKQAVERGDKTFNMSGGEQLRDYLPVSEVARHLAAFALEPGNNGIVNVCSAKPISVRRLAENWIAENAWSIKLNLGYYPYPDYEPMAFWGDRRKLDYLLEKSEKR